MFRISGTLCNWAECRDCTRWWFKRLRFIFLASECKCRKHANYTAKPIRKCYIYYPPTVWILNRDFSNVSERLDKIIVSSAMHNTTTNILIGPRLYNIIHFANKIKNKTKKARRRNAAHPRSRDDRHIWLMDLSWKEWTARSANMLQFANWAKTRGQIWPEKIADALLCLWRCTSAWSAIKLIQNNKELI